MESHWGNKLGQTVCPTVDSQQKINSTGIFGGSLSGNLVLGFFLKKKKSSFVFVCVWMYLSSFCLPCYGFQFSIFFLGFLSVKKWVCVSSAFLGPSLFCLFFNFDMLAFVLSYHILFYSISFDFFIIS